MFLKGQNPDKQYRLPRHQQDVKILPDILVLNGSFGRDTVKKINQIMYSHSL